MKQKFVWIAIAVLALCQFIRVEPLVVWSSETYMGIFVALMGIAVAVIIGYQAITANDIKKELREQKQDNEYLREEIKRYKEQISETIQSLKSKFNEDINTVNTKNSELEIHADKILSSTQESVAILNALIIENQNGPGIAFDAFEKMHEALFFGLEYESKNIDFIFSKLRQYGSKIYTLTFGGGFSYSNNTAYYCTAPFSGKSLRSVLDEKFLPTIKETEAKIRGHKLFSSISHDYSVLMEQFYNRIDTCATRHFPKGIEEMDEKFK